MDGTSMGWLYVWPLLQQTVFSFMALLAVTLLPVGQLHFHWWGSSRPTWVAQTIYGFGAMAILAIFSGSLGSLHDAVFHVADDHEDFFAVRMRTMGGSFLMPMILDLIIQFYWCRRQGCSSVTGEG